MTSDSLPSPEPTVVPRRRSPKRPVAAPRLQIENFAQLGSVDIRFGDLTVLVGPQATGKSLVLQLMKLAVDGRQIAKTMERYGLVAKTKAQFLARYLGEGVDQGWRADTAVAWNGKPVEPALLVRRPRVGRHSVYFVPAHRTLTLAEGYPPTFQQFRPETPFVVRQFSEELRQLLIDGLGEDLIFPQSKRLKGKVREKINDAIFHNGKLRDDASGVQRQLRLSFDEGPGLSYMTWTAGQREFIPLLIGLYYLLPAGGYAKRKDTNWVVIEEPEMGLHPKAILALMLLVLDLLSRGYRVVLSTHSPLVLEIVWGIGLLQKRSRTRWQPVLKMFGIDGVTKASAKGEVEMAEAALQKQYRVHYMDYDSQSARVTARDISDLDPSSSDPLVAGWGGLTGISGDLGKVIADEHR